MAILVPAIAIWIVVPEITRQVSAISGTQRYSVVWDRTAPTTHHQPITAHHSPPTTHHQPPPKFTSEYIQEYIYYVEIEQSEASGSGSVKVQDAEDSEDTEDGEDSEGASYEGVDAVVVELPQGALPMEGALSIESWIAQVSEQDGPIDILEASAVEAEASDEVGQFFCVGTL